MKSFAAVLAVSLLAACSSGGNGRTGTPSVSGSGTPTSSVAGGTGSSTPTGTTPPATSLRTSRGTIPGLRLDANSLTRGGDGTATFQFTLTNESNKALIYGDRFSDPAYGTGTSSNNVSGVYLADAVNRKKYFALQDTEKRCVCSDNLRLLDPGAAATLFATFPAPPDTVTTVTVVVPQFPALTGLTIASS